jgi:type I pantothenate kinase
MTDPFPLSEELRRRSAAARAAGTPFVVGVAGSVAVGKSTFSAGLRDAAAAWPERPRIEAIATDGFLFPNAALAERGLSMRKGFPESYDVAAMRTALAAVKSGARIALPRYSHVTYDVDSGDPLQVERPDILILDGLHLAQIEQSEPRLIDFLIYLDAPEAAIESWFTARLVPLMVAGRDDPTSFYYRFRDWDDAQRRDFAKRVWETINLPNLREHIVKDRDAADAVVTKAADHAISGVTYRPLGGFLNLP